MNTEHVLLKYKAKEILENCWSGYAKEESSLIEYLHGMSLFDLGNFTSNSLICFLKIFYLGIVFNFLLISFCRGGKYSEEDAKDVMVQILNVVAFCHLQGVVHRDLKPEVNIFLKLALQIRMLVTFYLKKKTEKHFIVEFFCNVCGMLMIPKSAFILLL